MRRARPAVTVGTAIGWTLGGGLAAVALIRLFRSDSVPILIGIQGVAGWALIPAFPLAAIALWKKKRALAGVATVIGIAQLVRVAGSVGWNGPQALAPGDLPVRLVSANLLYTNTEVRQLGDDLAAQDADVVVVQEVTDEVLAQLELSALWTDYPYRSTDPRPLFDGAATFSRYPIADARTIDVAGHPMLLTDLETPAGIVRLVNVHTVAPLTFADAASWAHQFPALDQLVVDSPYPTILAGDFNATLAHAPLEKLVDGPVRDAFRVAGSGLGHTWPRLDFPAPPLMRLDHVLVSPTLSVASIIEQVSVGSDHLRVVAELGIPRKL